MLIRIYADNSKSNDNIKGETPIDIDLPCPPHKGDEIYINARRIGVPRGYYRVDVVKLCINQDYNIALDIDVFYLVRATFEEADD